MRKHNTNDPKDVLSIWHNEYVPIEGKAQTEFGEIVRAVNFLIYRYYNDGERIALNGGIETCSPPARFLQARTNLEISSLIYYLADWYNVNDYEYKLGLDKLAKLVVEFLEDNPKLKEIADNDDFWNYTSPLGSRYDFEDYDEYAEEEW